MSMRGRLLSAAVAVPMAAVVVLSGAPPANALDPMQIIDIVKKAYDTYKSLTETHQLTLDEAMTRIIDAVNAAKADTLSHIDKISTVEAQSCARSAVIDFADIRLFSPDTQQAFARDTTACVSLAAADIAAVNDLGAVDQLGFAINLVGPIALLARSTVGFSTDALKATLIAADNAVVSRLNPHCSVTTIPYFNGLGKPIPSLAENLLDCTAYNGNQGHDVVEGRMPRGGWDFSVARAQATRQISYPVAVAALSVLAS
jgi:hypothetical protein